MRRIETHARRLDDGFEATLVLRAVGRWFRFGAFYGTPPGSHMGLWRTRGGFTGSLQGINFRVGRAWTGPCLTLLAHTRPLRNRGGEKW